MDRAYFLGAFWLPLGGPKTDVFKNKVVFLGLAILEASEIVMHEFWYN